MKKLSAAGLYCLPFDTYSVGPKLTTLETAADPESGKDRPPTVGWELGWPPASLLHTSLNLLPHTPLLQGCSVLSYFLLLLSLYQHLSAAISCLQQSLSAPPLWLQQPLPAATPSVCRPVQAAGLAEAAGAAGRAPWQGGCGAVWRQLLQEGAVHAGGGTAGGDLALRRAGREEGEGRGMNGRWREQGGEGRAGGGAEVLDE